MRFRNRTRLDLVSISSLLISSACASVIVALPLPFLPPLPSSSFAAARAERLHQRIALQICQRRADGLNGVLVTARVGWTG